MNAFWKGFCSLFSWIDCFSNQSPKERVDEILDNFYSDYPWIEKDDKKALENDSKMLEKDHNQLWRF